MDKETAKLLLAAAQSSTAPLHDMIPLLKQHCQRAEYETFLKGIGSVIFEVREQIVRRIFDSFPDLEQEEESACAERNLTHRRPADKQLSISLCRTF